MAPVDPLVDCPAAQLARHAECLAGPSQVSRQLLPPQRAVEPARARASVCELQKRSGVGGQEQRSRRGCRRPVTAFQHGRDQCPDPIYTHYPQAHTNAKFGPDSRDPPTQPPRRERLAAAQHVGDQVGREGEQLVAALPVEHRVDAKCARASHHRFPHEQVRRGRRQAPAIDVLERRREDRGALIERDQLHGDAGVARRRLDQLALVGVGVAGEDARERERPADRSLASRESRRHTGRVETSAEAHRGLVRPLGGASHRRECGIAQMLADLLARPGGEAFVAGAPVGLDCDGVRRQQDSVRRRDAPYALEQRASGGDAAALYPPRQRHAIGSGSTRQQLYDRALVFGEQRPGADASVYERAAAEVVANDRRDLALAI